MRAAADQVAAALGLDPMWLDDRPGSDFANAAPEGFELRLERAEFGSLVVWHLSGSDIVIIKLIAAAERWGERPNEHWLDVLELEPDAAALAGARAFAERSWAPSSAAWNALDEMEGALTHDDA